MASTTTGRSIRGTLIQPWVGHILTAGDFYTQGFNALVVPTDKDEVMFFSNDMAFGYFLYKAPGATLSGISPVFETHLNIPFDHRGARVDPMGFSTGLTLLGADATKGARAPFDFQELDAGVRSFIIITDRDRRLEIGKQMSPVYHVSADDPPTLIIHGTADLTVPLQQSNRIMEKFKEANVPCELVVKPGKAHGWLDIGQDSGAGGTPGAGTSPGSGAGSAEGPGTGGEGDYIVIASPRTAT